MNTSLALQCVVYVNAIWCVSFGCSPSILPTIIFAIISNPDFSCSLIFFSQFRRILWNWLHVLNGRLYSIKIYITGGSGHFRNAITTVWGRWIPFHCKLCTVFCCRRCRLYLFFWQNSLSFSLRDQPNQSHWKIP